MIDIRLNCLIARALSGLAREPGESAGVVVVTVDPTWGIDVINGIETTCISIGKAIGYVVASQNDKQTAMLQAMGRALSASNPWAREDSSWLMESRAEAHPFNVQLHVDAVRQAQEDPKRHAVVIVADRRGTETELLIEALREEIRATSCNGTKRDRGVEVVHLDIDAPIEACLTPMTEASRTLAN